jgi:hypothetical protein
MYLAEVNAIEKRNKQIRSTVIHLLNGSTTAKPSKYQARKKVLSPEHSKTKQKSQSSIALS